MRSRNDNNRNPLKKFHNSENRDEENANLNRDFGASIFIVFVVAKLTANKTLNWNVKPVLSKS